MNTTKTSNINIVCSECGKEVVIVTSLHSSVDTIIKCKEHGEILRFR